MDRLQMRSSAGAAIVFFAFLWGAYSARHNIFPIPTLFSIKALIVEPPGPPPSRYAFDRAGRLVSDASKTAIQCPSQTDRTAVLLLIGQSNAGNHGGQRFHSQHGDKVVNFFGGQCFVAASPLLGSDGTRGEYWTQLGNLLVESGAFEQVVLAPIAISGSEISRWSKGGDLHALMISSTAELNRARYNVTHTLWHQGEIDYVINTDEATYYNKFISIVDSLRDQGINSTVFVSIASKCLELSNGGTRVHSADNSIVRAQFALQNTDKGIRAGVNTDALLDELDRYDDCHFGASGAQKVAEAWAYALPRADERKLGLQTHIK